MINKIETPKTSVNNGSVNKKKKRKNKKNLEEAGKQSKEKIIKLEENINAPTKEQVRTS